MVMEKSDSYDIQDFLTPRPNELYDQLNKIGLIDRVKQVPQLGMLKNINKNTKYKFDYILLQLQLHSFIKNNLKKRLKNSYNSMVTINMPLSNVDRPTIYEILQIMIIIYNIGHFYNTFISSRAMAIQAKESKAFRDSLLDASDNELYQKCAIRLIDECNYQRIHLLNSFLALEKCDERVFSVKLAKELIYSYIYEDTLQDDDKLRYVFKLFRNIRTVSYIAYDLEITDTPFALDLSKEEAVKLLLTEMLDEYNDKTAMVMLFQHVSKFLDDALYNKKEDVICYYQISKKIITKLDKELLCHNNDYYKLFTDVEGALNNKYLRRRDYIENNVLKITFKVDETANFYNLLNRLEKIENLRCGYYDRHSGEKTLVVSVKEMDYKRKKILAANKAIKYIITELKNINDVARDDPRYILCAKFFLYYVFNERSLNIHPTLDENSCVLCASGYRTKIKELDSLLKKYGKNDDQAYETVIMKNFLLEDKKRDISICIPASIIVDKTNDKSELCELDGLILNPNRKENQVIFFEAKNIKMHPQKGKNHLIKKLEKLNIEFLKEDIEIKQSSAVYKYTI